MDFDESFPATMEGLRTALAAVEQFCTARNLTQALVSRIRIVVEELFTNTIKYGYGGEGDRPVRLCLMTGSTVRLTFEDEAPPFDPTGWHSARLAGKPEQYPEGQVGIAMVMSLSAKVQYEAIARGNRLMITIKP